MDSQIFTNTLCKEVVKIEPKFLSSNIQEVILQKLKSNVENVCTKHGYIKKDSCSIVKISMGELEIGTLSGFINYNVIFNALVCNPYIGTVIKAKINNINRFGLFSLLGYNNDGNFTPVLEIVIAKSSNKNENFDALNIDDYIDVEIIGKKFELGDKKIYAIGKIIKNNEKNISTKVKPSNLEEQQEEDDTSVNSDIEDDQVDEEELLTEDDIEVIEDGDNDAVEIEDDDVDGDDDFDLDDDEDAEFSMEEDDLVDDELDVESDKQSEISI